MEALRAASSATLLQNWVKLLHMSLLFNYPLKIITLTSLIKWLVICSSCLIKEKHTEFVVNWLSRREIET